MSDKSLILLWISLLATCEAFSFLRPTPSSLIIHSRVNRLSMTTDPAASVWYDDSFNIDSEGTISSRRQIIAGNWKLNPSTLSEARSCIHV